jgi:hypothetical protein
MIDPIKLKWRWLRRPIYPGCLQLPKSVERERQVTIGGDAAMVKGLTAMGLDQGGGGRIAGDLTPRGIPKSEPLVECRLVG